MSSGIKDKRTPVLFPSSPHIKRRVELHPFQTFNHRRFCNAGVPTDTRTPHCRCAARHSVHCLVEFEVFSGRGMSTSHRLRRRCVQMESFPRASGCQ